MDPNLAWEDPDGDGYDNLQEYNFGTNPNNSGSHPGNVPPHLIGWWQFDDGSGTLATDSSGNNETGTLGGVSLPVWTNGVVGSALSFNSSSNQDVVAPTPASSQLTTQLTVAAWVNVRDGAGGPLVTWLDGSDACGFALRFATPTSVVFRVYSTSAAQWISSAAAVVSSNTWTHMAGVYDGSTLSIYKNAALVGSAVTLTDAVSICGGNLGIAADLYSNQFFSGQLDDVRVYSKALSSNDLVLVYSDWNGPSPPPRGYYVDYENGNDLNNGTNPAVAWRHCPGDPNAVGVVPRNLSPGDTVFFKGGVRHVLAGDGNPLYQTGIGMYSSGTNGAPISYTSTNAWGNGQRAVITDNYYSGANTNPIAAFYIFGNDVSNLVFNNLEIGPMGGEASLPPVGSPGGNQAFSTTPSNGPVFFAQDFSGVNFAVPMVFVTATNVPQTTNGYIQNDGSTTVTGTMTCLGGPFVPVETNFTIAANAVTNIDVTFGPTPTTGTYTNGVTFRFNNGQVQVLTNELIGFAATPARNGYGIWVNGGLLRDSTIENCYFHSLGYWFNQAPMDAHSIEVEPVPYNRVSSTAIGLTDAISVTITNCEFTKAHTAINLAYSNTSTNDSIVYNNFHDYMTWGINMAGPNTGSGGPYVLDWITIAHNQFTGMGWAYSSDWWTGYGPGTHQDPIFHVTNGSGVVSNGPHINICFNTWTTTHTNEEMTGDIYLETAPSANIYNNLFNVPNQGDPNLGGKVIEISIETNRPCLIRVLNNTIVINTPSNSVGPSQCAGIHWGCGGGNLLPLNTWPSNAVLQIENNLTYDFYQTNGQDLAAFIDVVTNVWATNYWTMDYNDWRTLSANPENWFWWHNGYSEPNIPDLTGGLSLLRTNWGFEVHGMTNDPLFASLAFGSTTNSAGNNYRITTNSPCIEAGANLSDLNLPGLNVDINGNPRPASTNWDIGAYQH